MAGSKNTSRTRDWLYRQALRRPEDRDPEFVKLYPRLMARARTLGNRLIGNADPAVARDVATIFEESAERVASDRTEESTLHIRDLVLSHPGRTAKELRKLADDSIIGDMTLHTFEKKVSAARKLRVAR